MRSAFWKTWETARSEFLQEFTSLGDGLKRKLAKKAFSSLPAIWFCMVSVMNWRDVPD
ncbi:MAG: hypothetical protein JW786_13025 [Desulfobacterales bacterium]|nr:hypothetical protein [Desulfobacterales bacterium]